MTRRNPIHRRATLSISESCESKHYNCDHYSKCLKKAVRKNWKNFVCSLCPVFKEYKKARAIIETENLQRKGLE